MSEISTIEQEQETRINDFLNCIVDTENTIIKAISRIPKLPRNHVRYNDTETISNIVRSLGYALSQLDDVRSYINEKNPNGVF